MVVVNTSIIQYSYKFAVTDYFSAISSDDENDEFFDVPSDSSDALPSTDISYGTTHINNNGGCTFSSYNGHPQNRSNDRGEYWHPFTMMVVGWLKFNDANLLVHI